jgi:hypothetical protein
MVAFTFNTERSCHIKRTGLVPNSHVGQTGYRLEPENPGSLEISRRKIAYGITQHSLVERF